MEKTTVYLTTAQKAALAEAARTEGRSEARLIRDGIDGVLARHRSGEVPLSLAGDASPSTSASAAASGAPATRPRWMTREAFVRQFLGHQADPALGRELRELAPEMTDEMTDGLSER
jgi:hypothetical protein